MSKPYPYLRGNPGKLSPEKQRKYGLALLKLRNEKKRETGKIPFALSYQAIATKVGVCFYYFNCYYYCKLKMQFTNSW